MVWEGEAVRLSSIPIGPHNEMQPRHRTLAIYATLGIVPFLLFTLLDTGHSTTQFAIAILFAVLGSVVGFLGGKAAQSVGGRAYFIVQTSLNALVVLFAVGVVLVS